MERSKICSIICFSTTVKGKFEVNKYNSYMNNPI